MNKLMKIISFAGLFFLIAGLVMMLIGKVGHGYQNINALIKNDVNNERVPAISDAFKGTKNFTNVKSLYLNNGVPVTVKSGNVKHMHVIVNSKQKIVACN